MSRSSEKAMRVAERKRILNKSTRSATKTYIFKAEAAIASGDAEAAQEAVKKAVSVMDKAARKSIIHRNAAARRKSHLMRKFSQAFQS